MFRRSSLTLSSALAVLCVAACSSATPDPEPITPEPAATNEPATDAPPAPEPGFRRASDAGSPDASADADAGADPNAALVAQVMARLQTCTKVSKSDLRTDKNAAPSVPVCGLTGAVFYHADMDIVCDGKPSAQCNAQTDPWFQAQSAAKDSKGEYLDAAQLPFIVLPIPSEARFDYKAAGIKLGSVAMVIYKGQYAVGILGDIGPTEIIGEASYAMAKKLGINPDPKVGGTPSGVTYVVFTGPTGVVKKNEDQAETAKVAMSRVQEMLAANPAK
jgi:hypothetical protein